MINNNIPSEGLRLRHNSGSVLCDMLKQSDCRTTCVSKKSKLFNDLYRRARLLGGKVEIQFLHYHSETEAAEKWYRRAARVNWDKLFIIGMEQNLCTEDCIRAFDKLNFERKLFFSSKDLPDLKSNCFLDIFAEQGEVGDPYKRADVFYKALTELNE